jgi:hypothetical protein
MTAGPWMPLNNAIPVFYGFIPSGKRGDLGALFSRTGMAKVEVEE